MGSMIARLITAVIVFALSMFCGLVIVATGMLSGRFNSMYPYTAADVCTTGETLVLETAETTSVGTTVIDNTVHTNVAFLENTVYCVDASGGKREVTSEAYNAFEALKTRIGWYATFAFFAVTMILILIFERRILKQVDKVIGYKPPTGA
jgi:hypothetical protein